MSERPLPLKGGKNKSHRNTVIAGVGNRLLGDEGVGLHVIDNLSQIPMPSNVDVVDCGCDLLSLISHLNKPQKIIVIDAVRAGGKPGEIYRLDYNELKTRGIEMQSSHQVRATDALGLLKQIYPVLAGCEIIIIGIEPEAIELSICLSEKVRESIADVVRLILEEISCSLPE